MKFEVLTLDMLYSPTFLAFSISVITSGTEIAGENYTLNCSITVTEEVVDTLTAHWSGTGVHMDGVTATNVSILTQGNFSTFTIDLTFTPLRQSHDGDYTCRADLATFIDSSNTGVLTTGKFDLKIKLFAHAFYTGCYYTSTSRDSIHQLPVHCIFNYLFLYSNLQWLLASLKLKVNYSYCIMLYVLYTVPPVTVQISGGRVLVVEFGESLALHCTISGADNLHGNITFQWRGPNKTILESISPRLKLSTVSFGDAGIYTCTATVSSPYLNEDILENDTVSVIVSG